MEYSEYLPWKSRGYLPHVDVLGELQSITFRQADSLPSKVLNQLEVELKDTKKERVDVERRKRIEAWLDRGFGTCALAHPEVALKIQETLLKFDGEKYNLIAWCIMPNHVHLLLKPLSPVSRIVQSLKSYTSRWTMKRNEELDLNISTSTLWMPDYWDRFIRDERHYHAVIGYIHDNPVKAGLCERPSDWRWSSAAYFQDRC